jgi:hypothetical protein
LGSEDVVVIWRGINDIRKNNIRVAIKYVCHYVEKNEKVHTVIMKSPHRHDLIPSSCVNSDVIKFNEQVEKKKKINNNVNMLETDIDRKYFTKHGQPFN